MAGNLDDLVDKAIERILSAVKPKKIFLFGSAAHGKMRENSDIDMMVVVPNGMHRRKASQGIYRKMIGLGFAVDIVVVTEEDLEKYRDTPGYIIQSAMREGKLMYAA